MKRITRTLVSHVYFKRIFVIPCDTLKTTAQKTVTDKYSYLVPIPLIQTDNLHYRLILTQARTKFITTARESILKLVKLQSLAV